MKYPNLAEVIKYHPYHISTFANFADATKELLEAAFAGTENLTDEELGKIARYSGIPRGVISCPHLIQMDRRNIRHKKMVEDLVTSLYFIWEEAQAGSKEADLFMNYGRPWVVNLELAFLDGRATYGMYLGTQERVQQAVSFIQNEKRRPRGLGGRTDE